VLPDSPAGRRPAQGPDTVLIVAGWGPCLLPFAFAPAGVTLACFAAGGLIHGPFIPLTYTLLQSSASGDRLPTVLAARSAIVMVASPLRTAPRGPFVATLGAAWTLTASDTATVVLAIVSGMLWTRHRQPRPVDRHASAKAAKPAEHGLSATGQSRGLLSAALPGARSCRERVLFQRPRVRRTRQSARGHAYCRHGCEAAPENRHR
jgi:hypothetical protein